MDEQQLLFLAQHGDRHSIGELYEQYVDPIHRFFWYQFHDNTIAEDLTQDTFVELIHSLPSYRGDGSAKNWIYAIAKRQALHFLQEKYRIPKETLPDWLPDDDTLIDPDEQRQHEANRRRVEMLLQSLSKEDRKVVELTKLRGLSSTEAASVTGDTPVSIRVRVHRALKKLQKK
jgi:RNA polymerase sigma-70 factor (ECF subfamily)